MKSLNEDGGVHIVPEQSSCFCKFYIEFEHGSVRVKHACSARTVLLIFCPYSFSSITGSLSGGADNCVFFARGARCLNICCGCG